MTPMTKKGQDMWIVTPHGVLPPKSRLDFASVLSKSSLPGFAAEGKGAQASGAVLFQWRTQLERVSSARICLRPFPFLLPFFSFFFLLLC